MTKLRTHHALILSVVALLVCGAMLVGTTYAWFIDTAVNTGNRINAGYLNVDLLMDKQENGVYESIRNGQGDIFDEQGNGANWEPGTTKIVYLAVSNNETISTLAFKYSFLLEIEGELSKVLQYAIIPEECYQNGLFAEADAQNDVDAWDYVLDTPGVTYGDLREGTVIATASDKLTIGSTDYFALAVHMDKGAGDDYQGGDVTIDVMVRGTQTPAESGSLGDDYDIDAGGVYAVDSPDVLRDHMSDGGIFVLTKDIILDGSTPVHANNYKYPSILVFDEANMEAVLDLNGYTLSYDGRPEATQLASLIRVTEGFDLTIKNGTIRYAQAAFGTYLLWAQGEGTHVKVENCQFECTDVLNYDKSENGTMFYATTGAKVDIDGGTYDTNGLSYLMNVANSGGSIIHAHSGDFLGQDISFGDNLYLKDVTDPAQNHLAEGAYVYDIGNSWYRVGDAEQVSADLGTDAWVAVNGKVFTSFADVAENINADWNGVVKLTIHGSIEYKGEALDVPSAGANATGAEVKTILVEGLAGSEVKADNAAWNVNSGVAVTEQNVTWVTP